MSDSKNLWLVYAKASMPLEHPANMGGDAVYVCLLTFASGAEDATSQAKTALSERKLELTTVKHCEEYNEGKRYSHDDEIVNDIRKTARLALENNALQVGGYIDAEIEEEEQ